MASKFKFMSEIYDQGQQDYAAYSYVAHALTNLDIIKNPLSLADNPLGGDIDAFDYAEEETGSSQDNVTDSQV